MIATDDDKVDTMFREWLDIAVKLEVNVMLDCGIYLRDPEHTYDDTKEETERYVLDTKRV